MQVNTATLMDNVQLDIDTLEAIAPTFWEVMARENLSQEEQAEIIRCARLGLSRNPYNPDRGLKLKPPVKRTDYIQKMLSESFKLIRRGQELDAKEEELVLAGRSHLFEQEMLKNSQAADPLIWRGSETAECIVLKEELAIADEFGNTATLELAPYDAKFVGPSPIGIYLDQPYYMPFFDLNQGTGRLTAMATNMALLRSDDDRIGSREEEINSRKSI